MKTGIRAIMLASAFFLFAGCNNFLNESPADGSVSEATIRARGIWIVGGCKGSYLSPVSQIDLFDPVTGIWYPSVTSLPVPVSFAAVGTGTYGGDRVLIVAGGFDATGNPISTVQRYDVDADAWLLNGDPLPAVRANAAGVMNSNRLYVLGGTTNLATAGGTALNTIYEYSLGDNLTTTKTAMAAVSMNRQAVPYEDTVLYLGGRTATATVDLTHNGYSVTSNGATAAAETALPTTLAGRVGNSLVIYKPSAGMTKLLSIGGFQNIATTTSFLINTGTGASTNLTYYLNYPFTGAWAASPNGLPVSLACGAAALYEDTLYYFGGVQSFAFASCQSGVYSSSLTGFPTLTWKSQENMPVARYGHAAVRFQ
jgi:hypothetical protein